jgi:hypothetical protein
MPANNVQNLRNMDAAYTSLIIQNGEELTQSIASGSFTPNGSNNVVTVPMRAVGLCRGFIIKVNASFTNTATSNAAKFTNIGAANLLSNFTLTDLDNYQRINTTGYHMNALNTAKESFPFGAALLSTAMDSPIKYGNNLSVISGTVPAVNTGTAGTIEMYYYVPLAYGKHDLRGALFTGVTNATGYLAFTINPTPYVALSGDPTLAVYTDNVLNSAAVIVPGVVTYNVYQCYIDQLPKYTQGQAAGAPILPPLSIRTQYRLFNTVLYGVTPNNDFPIPFSNFQDFLSATIIYDQAGTLNPGTDITAFKLLAANTLQFFNLDPFTQGLRQRIRIKTDFPTGEYQFDFRDAPISTNQAGNIQLIVNPSSAAAGTTVLVGWESFARVDTVLGAQSLAAS